MLLCYYAFMLARGKKLKQVLDKGTQVILLADLDKGINVLNCSRTTIDLKEGMKGTITDKLEVFYEGVMKNAVRVDWGEAHDPTWLVEEELNCLESSGNKLTKKQKLKTTTATGELLDYLVFNAVGRVLLMHYEQIRESRRILGLALDKLPTSVCKESLLVIEKQEELLKRVATLAAQDTGLPAAEIIGMIPLAISEIENDNDGESS